MHRTPFRSLAAAATALCIAAPALAKSTITVTDVLGRTVETPARAERILVGFYFEDVFAVGGEDVYDRVVAISRKPWESWRGLQWKAYVAAKPRIGRLVDVGDMGGGDFSLEVAVAAKPDVAIIAAWQFKAMGPAVGRLEAAGVPVVVLDYNAQTVEKHIASTRALGAVLGAQDRAERLAKEYAAAHADVLARVAKIKSRRPKVYVELGRKGAGEVDNTYGDTMWGRLVEAAGGANIAKGRIAKWGPLSPELVLAENPDVVFLAGSGWFGRPEAVIMGPGVERALTHARMQPYLGRPGWGALSAVKNRRVHALYHGGARTLYDYAFFQYVAKALHPSAFKDVDPQATLDRFFETYMPIRFSGVYMTKLP